MAAAIWETLIFSSAGAYEENFFDRLLLGGGIRYGSLTSRYGIKIGK